MKTTFPTWLADADADPQALIKEARRRQHRRYAAVGLAIVALLAAAAGVTVSVTGLGGHAAGRRAPGGTTRPASAVAYADGGRVPPYYVFTWSNLQDPSGAAVRLTATGATIGTVQPAEADSTIVGVTGAPDDRTFILDERTLKPQPHPVVNAEPHSFYRLRLSASGRPSSVTRVPVTEPNGVYVTGFALSPDGTELAVAGYPAGKHPWTPVVSELTIYSIATGAVLRSWSATGTIGTAPGSSLEDAEGLSWISDQTIGFTWEGSSIYVYRTSVRLLDLGLGGHNLLADSRQVLYLGLRSPGCQELIVTPDGSAVVCAMLTTVVAPHRPTGEYAFVDYPTAAGKPVRTLARGTIKNLDRLFVDVLWSNPSGSVLIGVIPRSGGPTNSEIGMITAGKFTPLPAGDLGERNYAAVAW
jgi:hypothetical protein